MDIIVFLLSTFLRMMKIS